MTLAVAYSKANCEVLQSISWRFWMTVHAGSCGPPHGWLRQRGRVGGVGRRVGWRVMDQVSQAIGLGGRRG